MKVSVDVYTKDIDAALKAFEIAFKQGAKGVSLSSSENYETNEFEYLNLMFEAEHTSSAIPHLDDGPFTSERRDL